jgi:hypothetical protein
MIFKNNFETYLAHYQSKQKKTVILYLVEG